MTQLHQSMLDEIQRRSYAESTTGAYDRIIKDFAFYFHRSPDQLEEKYGPDQRAKKTYGSISLFCCRWPPTTH